LFNAIKKTIRTFTVNFNGREALVTAITKTLLEIDKKYEKDIEFIYDSYKSKEEKTKLLI